jgi:hypothetical protein
MGDFAHSFFDIHQILAILPTQPGRKNSVSVFDLVTM